MSISRPGASGNISNVAFTQDVFRYSCTRGTGARRERHTCVHRCQAQGTLREWSHSQCSQRSSLPEGQGANLHRRDIVCIITEYTFKCIKPRKDAPKAVPTLNLLKKFPKALRWDHLLQCLMTYLFWEVFIRRRTLLLSDGDFWYLDSHAMHSQVFYWVPCELLELLQAELLLLTCIGTADWALFMEPVNLFHVLQVDFSSFSFTKYLRAAALMVNGVEPVELNPNFMAELVAAGKGKGIILYDEIGGTLEPTASFGSGKTSRSLLAVYQVSLTFLTKLFAGRTSRKQHNAIFKMCVQLSSMNCFAMRVGPIGLSIQDLGQSLEYCQCKYSTVLNFLETAVLHLYTM